MNKQKYGTVRGYDNKLGRGWITSSDGSEGVAVYQNDIDLAGLGQLGIGQVVGFRVSEGQPKAIELWATWSNR